MPPRAEPAPRSHVGALIGSGLLGGLIGAGLLYGVQEWRGAPAGDDPRLVQLEQRVGALAQQRSTPGQPAADGALDGRIAALESATATFDQRLQAAQGAAEQAGVRATEALNRPAPPQNDAAVTELSERVTRMDEQVRGNQQQIQQVQSGLQPVPQVQSGLQQVQADLQQVRSELQAGAQARQAAEGRVADLDRRLSEQDRRLSEQDRRAGEQEGRLADLSRQVTATTAATTQPAIRVILAERLGTALRNGAPYTDVLAALRNAETEPARLSALEPFAQQGAPTAAELAQDFGPLGARILREERPADAAWTDRLLRMADRVVTVRPVNDAGTAGVTGLVARIEQALGRGRRSRRPSPPGRLCRSRPGASRRIGASRLKAAGGGGRGRAGHRGRRGRRAQPRDAVRKDQASMWRALVFIGLLCVAAFGAVWLADRPGTVLVTFGGYEMQTTVAVAAVALVGRRPGAGASVGGGFRAPAPALAAELRVAGAPPRARLPGGVPRHGGGRRGRSDRGAPLCRRGGASSRPGAADASPQGAGGAGLRQPRRRGGGLRAHDGRRRDAGARPARPLRRGAPPGRCAARRREYATEAARLAPGRRPGPATRCSKRAAPSGTGAAHSRRSSAVPRSASSTRRARASATVRCFITADALDRVERDRDGRAAQRPRTP